MVGKTQIVEQLGETALLLPRLVAAGLRANDRAKYYMSVLLACREHAARRDQPPPDLAAEREASGDDDATLDGVVAGCVAGPGGTLFMPRADHLVKRLLESVEEMCAPLRVADAGASASVESYERRLRDLRDRLEDVTEDVVPVECIDLITRADRSGTDSLHLLVMDLHRELNRIQARLAEQLLDGAHVYALAPADETLVKAFMRGVNATSKLRFDHPGLGTTATRIQDDLVIQNDLGTTEAHVIVVHVAGLTVSLTYTDVHPLRLEFFKSLFEGRGIDWRGRSEAAAGEFETCVGRRACASVAEVEDVLAFLGSRLVFLIDWNRARKRLSRFMKKSDAVLALRWAADHDYGHRAFLESGGERLIYNALERTASTQTRFGARLDEVLGRQPTLAFVQAVLRITSEALQQRRSLRLVRDEVQAELLDRLQESQQGVLALAADHAALIVGIALGLHDALVRMRSDPGGRHLPGVAERAKHWETKADDLVATARHAHRGAQDSATVGLLPAADDVADGLEEATFLMAQLPRYGTDVRAVEMLEPLARLAALGAQEYVKCLEIARDIRRNGTRDDIQEFLIAVDRVSTVEHESDEAERRAIIAVLDAAENFRTLHVLSQIAQGLEESVDALARCSLMLRDHVISEMLVQ